MRLAYNVIARSQVGVGADGGLSQQSSLSPKRQPTPIAPLPCQYNVLLQEDILQSTTPHPLLEQIYQHGGRRHRLCYVRCVLAYCKCSTRLTILNSSKKRKFVAGMSASLALIPTMAECNRPGCHRICTICSQPMSRWRLLRRAQRVLPARVGRGGILGGRSARDSDGYGHQ